MYDYNIKIFILRGHKQAEDEGRLTFAYRCFDLSLQDKPLWYNFNDDLFQSGSLVHPWLICQVLEITKTTQGRALYFNIYICGFVEDTEILNLLRLP